MMGREIRCDYRNLIKSLSLGIIIPSMIGIFLDNITTFYLETANEIMINIITAIVVFAPPIISGIIISNSFKGESRKVVFLLAFAAGYICFGILSIFTSMQNSNFSKLMLVFRLIGDILFFWYPFVHVVLYKSDSFKILNKTFNKDSFPFVFMSYYFAINLIMVTSKKVDPGYTNLETLLSSTVLSILFGLVSAISSILISRENRSIGR